MVDLASGTTIAARSFERALERDLDLLAESAEELFHRADLSALETSLPGLTPDSAGRREAVQKVIAQSRQLLYVFLRSQVRPNLILVTVFTFIPAIGSLALSLTEWDVFSPPEFIGLDNYGELLGDSSFWIALRNTFIYAFGR